jgi:hypothetical protein
VYQHLIRAGIFYKEHYANKDGYINIKENNNNNNNNNNNKWVNFVLAKS